MNDLLEMTEPLPQKFTAAVTAGTRFIEHDVRTNSSMDGSRVHEVLLIAERISATDSCWRRERACFMGVASKRLPIQQ